PTAALTITRSISTAVGHVGPSPVLLSPAHPNPVAALTDLAYALPSPQLVPHARYDVLRRDVPMHVDEALPSGTRMVVFDAGRRPSGVYTYRLEAGPYRQARLLTVVR